MSIAMRTSGRSTLTREAGSHSGATLRALVRFAWVVPFVVVVAGCPRPLDGAPDAGPGGSPFITCSDVSECPGFVDGAASQVVRCDGVCLTICNGVDEACPDPAQFCDANGTCAAGCRDSRSCPGQLCVAGVCQDGSSECASKCDCDPGEICNPDGQCVAAGTTCATGADCPRGPRTPADDCEAFSCNGFSDQCFDPSPTPCTQAAECIGRPGCTGGAVCACTSSGACVPDVDCTVATEGAACGADNFCDDVGDCQALPACTADAQCTAFDLTCNEGRGKCERAQACTSNAQCTAAPNTFCIVADGFCAQPSCNNGGTTCNANQDCSADGRCVTAGTGTPCSGDSTCAADQFCSFTLSPAQCAVGCRDNTSCPIDQDCNGAHQCVGGGGGGGGFGDSCPNGDADCQSPMFCGFFTGTCAESCGSDADCIGCSARNGSCTCGAALDGFCG
ncbi:MAG: hypothetical protein Q8O67_15265 [Deltaproteobacteria bacterium]|nr:hypothetical protein [Deltaproteobacteria bacterium]